MPYQLLIALRYLKSRKRHRRVSFSTLISTGGVAVGVGALLIVLAVMSGFHEDLQGKILGANPHLLILDRAGEMIEPEWIMEGIKDEPHVLSQSPFVSGQVMISAGGRAQGINLRGIIPEFEIGTTDVERYMKSGSLRELKESGDKEALSGIILGRELAERLSVTRGDTVKLISPFGGIGPLGNIPKVMRFEVKGIFEVGMFEYDSNLALTALAPAQEFLDMGDAVTGVQVRVDDIYKAREIGKSLAEKLGGQNYARDWMEMNKNLLAALKLEKLAMFVILALIVIVAAFNIVSTQIMSVIEKEREIAILKAMGATSGGIMSVFMIQGFIIGIIGTVIGLSGGLIVSYLLDTYQIIKLPADVYYLAHLPAKVNISDFALVSASAILISFLATIYPARQAARLSPIEPLRYE